MPNYVERVADRVESVRIVKLLLSLLALPFYLLGVLAAVVWLAVRWCVAAVLVGFSDVRRGDDDAG